MGDESDPETHATYEVEVHQVSSPDPNDLDHVEVCAEVTRGGERHRQVVRVDPNHEPDEPPFDVQVDEDAPDGAAPGSPCTRNVITNNSPRFQVRRSADDADPQVVCVGVLDRNIRVFVEQTE